MAQDWLAGHLALIELLEIVRGWLESQMRFTVFPIEWKSSFVFAVPVSFPIFIADAVVLEGRRFAGQWSPFVTRNAEPASVRGYS